MAAKNHLRSKKKRDPEKMTMVKLGLLAAILLSLSGCGRNDPQVTPSDEIYFPLKVGMYSVYNVDETKYAELEPPSVLHYDLMIEVTDSFPSAGSFRYVLTRLIRSSASEAWSPLDVWSSSIEDGQAIVTEGNLSFIRLSLPAFEGKTWDGNALNSMDNDEYRISDRGFSFLAYTDCLRVMENDEDNLVYRDKRQGVYAPHVGLVYYTSDRVTYCTEGNCTEMGSIKSGDIFTMTLTEYGGG